MSGQRIMGVAEAIIYEDPYYAEIGSEERENAYVRHYEAQSKQHWTERNDRNLNEET